jgi:hypothetical protein
MYNGNKSALKFSHNYHIHMDKFLQPLTLKVYILLATKLMSTLAVRKFQTNYRTHTYPQEFQD